MKERIVALGILCVVICNGCHKIPMPSISSLECGSVGAITPTLDNGFIFSHLLIIPYKGGNGLPYSGTATPSTGVTGLIATLHADTLTTASGYAAYNISGTPSGVGKAFFSINFVGFKCVLRMDVSR